jgi:hypothetical protein
MCNVILFYFTAHTKYLGIEQGGLGANETPMSYVYRNLPDKANREGEDL